MDDPIPSPRSGPRSKWIQGLTPEQFEKLLECLNADREQAAARYEQFRTALITFFQFRGSHNPAEDTDIVFDRVGRRLSQGHEIFTPNTINYFYAVARNVWRERLASPQAEIPLEEDLLSFVPVTPSPLEVLETIEQDHFREQRVTCLEACLQLLEAEERSFIVAYYQDTGRAKIRNRQALAARLGIPLPALRVRACRIRDKLETCVARCLKRQF
jgi:DNA-directed RNA polymerase specialized sigma24 family protein